MNPTGTTQIMEQGGRQRLTHYKNIILKGIQAAGKKPVNWYKIKEINQEPTENPLTFCQAEAA